MIDPPSGKWEGSGFKWIGYASFTFKLKVEQK